jgi:tRNA(adenine34) deaminase
MLDDNARYMQCALREAERALEIGEVPVGCVIVHEGEIIGKAHNQREVLQDPTAHAEILAITQAAAHLRSWRLENTKLYVTLEPCPMCAGAIIQARVAEVIYGAADPKAGCLDSHFHLSAAEQLNHRFEVISGILGEECSSLMQAFFASRRQG